MISVISRITIRLERRFSKTYHGDQKLEVNCRLNDLISDKREDIPVLIVVKKQELVISLVATRVFQK